MIDMYKFNLVLLFIVLILCNGCDEARKKVAIQNQSTPEKLLQKMNIAILDNNQKMYLECFDEKSQVAAEQNFSFIIFLKSFKNEVINNYGEEITKESLQLPIKNIFIWKFNFDESSVSEKAVIEIVGDKAIYYYPSYKYTKQELYKKNNYWYYNNEIVPINLFCPEELVEAIQFGKKVIENKQNIAYEDLLLLINMKYYINQDNYTTLKTELLQILTEDKLSQLEALL